MQAIMKVMDSDVVNVEGEEGSKVASHSGTLVQDRHALKH